MKQQADKEFVAMRRVIEALSTVDKSAQARVVAYVVNRLETTGIEPAGNQPEPAPAQPQLALQAVPR